MRPESRSVSVWGDWSGGWAPFAVPAGAQINRGVRDLANWRLHQHANSSRGASGRALIRQVVHLLADGTSMWDHDVSGAGWQTVNRGTESITTMMPVRQCGHSRKDRPVTTSKRSR